MPKCEKSAYIWNGETNNDTRSQIHNRNKKMNRKRIFATGCLCALFGATLSAQSVPAEQVFAGYLKQAQKFADDFPREKAYLHFDNTSYYVGDTIWFKAYVTLDAQPTPSSISRPLYVELVDQAGHIADKQIVKLEKGEGAGQFVLPHSMFSGYYEVRAYTRWMLGFSEQQYFSRTLPVYKRVKENNEEQRSITNYKLSESMEQRPESVTKRLAVRFFPEGGQLVQGVPSRVAFKAESEKEGSVEVTGALYDAEGKQLTPIATVHDGMGRFSYTPTDKPAEARVTFEGREYKFKLPEALPTGYVMAVDNNAGSIAVSLASAASTPRDTVAVFVSHQGRPYACQLMSCEPGGTQQFTMLTRNLPAGVLQLSVINRQGHTLCERFSYVYPKARLQIEAAGLSGIYAPFEPIRCELQVKDATGAPVAGSTLSVSIRDALRSDYLEYDNNMFTDLLFTSDLKGYIHQPGYYFVDLTQQKLDELDMVMMIHGWRKYDMEQLIGSKPFTPEQMPEQNLILNGKVRSVILKKPMKDINLTVMVKPREGGLITGGTVTDEQGKFSIPLDDFTGTEEALIQTRKANKSRNKDATIMLDRNFSPELRPLDFSEMNPEWKDLTQLENATSEFDSLLLDSLIRSGNYMLDEVVVSGKKRKRFTDTQTSEQSIDAYYDVRRTVDQLRDEGKFVQTIPDFLEMMNSQFYWDRRDDSYTYRQKPLVFIMDGKVLSGTEKRMMLTEIDGLSSIIICQGSGALGYDIVQNSNATTLSEATGVDDATADIDTDDSMNATDVETTESTDVGGENNGIKESILSDITKYVFVYLVPLPYLHLLDSNQTAALGTRRTVLQGYTPVMEYYSPSYPDRELYAEREDQRRTLYWNPSVKTDENGRAVINCYNNQYSTPLVIEAETLTDGKIGTLTHVTLPLNGKEETASR